MDTFLWVLQWILAAAFLAAGAMKAFMPEGNLRSNPQMAWIEDAGISQARTAGVAELLAAVGLILPGLLDIAPVLTPLAAVGLVVLMVLAARLHLSRNETQMVATNSVIAVVALVVAIGRFATPA